MLRSFPSTTEEVVRKMPPKWAVIAKNEYYILTSSIREIRPYFPFLVAGGLLFFVVVAIPYFVNAVVDDVVAFFLSQVAMVAMPLLSFMFFIFFMTFPITYTLRDIKAEQQGILLKAPIRPSDVLLGEFLGELPIYGVFIVLVTGTLTALFRPLGIGVSGQLIIILSLVATLSSALWIGTVIAALLRTRLGRSARGRDMGKALGILIALPLVGVMYAFMSGLDYGWWSDPSTGRTIRLLLSLFPSSWASDVFIRFASGGSGALYAGVLRLGGILLFFGVLVWGGMKIADRAYSAEAGTFSAAWVHEDGILYRTIQKRGGSFGTLVVCTLKVFGRRFQNLSWIAYVVGLGLLMDIFLISPEEPLGGTMMSSVMVVLLSAMVASDMTIRGKETLFLYKKVPKGVGKLIKARLVQGWLVVVPMAAVLMALSLVRAPVTFWYAVAGILRVMFMGAGCMVLALGLFLLIPAYTERGGAFILNVFILVQGLVFLMILSALIFGENTGLLAMSAMIWVFGSLLLFVGKIRLESME